MLRMSILSEIGVEISGDLPKGASDGSERMKLAYKIVGSNNRADSLYCADPCSDLGIPLCSRGNPHPLPLCDFVRLFRRATCLSVGKSSTRTCQSNRGCLHHPYCDACGHRLSGRTKNSQRGQIARHESAYSSRQNGLRTVRLTDRAAARLERGSAGSDSGLVSCSSNRHSKIRSSAGRETRCARAAYLVANPHPDT